MAIRESLSMNEIVTPTGRRILLDGTAAPAAGAWKVGDTVYNSAPAAAGSIGWVCTTAGTPGTWKAFGTIAS